MWLGGVGGSQQANSSSEKQFRQKRIFTKLDWQTRRTFSVFSFLICTKRQTSREQQHQDHFFHSGAGRGGVYNSESADRKCAVFISLSYSIAEGQGRGWATPLAHTKCTKKHGALRWPDLVPFLPGQSKPLPPFKNVSCGAVSTSHPPKTTLLPTTPTPSPTHKPPPQNKN